MTPHLHRRYVEGCYRCELGKDEIAADEATRVLLTVMHLYERFGRVSMREVAEGAGLTLSVTHRHLRNLREAELVTWDPKIAATVRPLVEVVR